MEETKKIILIDGKSIEAVEKDILQSTLDFYHENPRIKSIIESEFGDHPTQEQIESKMRTLDNVKELKRSIIANGGLLEPIIVRDNVALEGNCRLAAYRLLNDNDPIKWSHIRAIQLPSSVTEDQIFSMLGTMHIIGKTPWSPFEQASYLKRKLTVSRKSIDAIADELGMTRSAAKLDISTLDLMAENDDMAPSKWSYYHELKKNSAITKANENYPQYDITETIIENIKNGNYSDAREIRKVGKVMGATGETAHDAIVGYISGELSLDESLELVESTSKIENIKSKIKAFTATIIKEQEFVRENISSDVSLQFQIKNLRQQLSNILGIE